MSSTAFRVGRMAGTLRLHSANVHVWRRTLRIFSNAAHTKNRRRRHARTAGKINRSEEHTSELQSLMRISYAVFCLKKKKTNTTNNNRRSTAYIQSKQHKT